MSDLRTHKLSTILIWLYNIAGGGRRRSIASLIFKILFKLEGGQYRSASVRFLMKRDYSVEVGAHSYGDCFIPGAFAPSVIVGNFVSIAKGVRVFTQNHPIDRASTHPYFYEHGLGIIDEDQLAPSTCVIESDVWIGQNAIILPGCKRIETGSIVGAGAVVTKDVPAYAIITGNPAKILRYRFNEEYRDLLLASRWWDRPVDEIKKYHHEFCSPITEVESDSELFRLL